MIENYTCECGHTADKHVEVGCVADHGQGICDCLETPKSIGNILLLATVTAQRDALLEITKDWLTRGHLVANSPEYDALIEKTRAAVTAAESDGAK